MTLLAVDLKEGTKTVHVEAERSKFIKYFFKGEITAVMYGRFLVSLYQVYSALEKATTKPELLIAHSYVRYLGDLSGGQILAKKLQKYNHLPEGKGVVFYQFDEIEDKNEFKDQYRIRLNQVEVDEETHRQIVEESCQAFIRNIDIFQEFDQELVGLPLTRKEQGQKRDEEKAALEAQAGKEQETEAANKATGVLASLAPWSLINSLAIAVGLKSSASSA